MAKFITSSLLVLATTGAYYTTAFAPSRVAFKVQPGPRINSVSRLNYIDEKHSTTAEVITAAPVVSSAELETMLNNWDEGPLVIDAFATWCRPCVRMSEDYDAAATELQGKARLVKLDIDQDPKMARQLGISSVPTFLFLDEFKGDSIEQGKKPKAILKEKMVGTVGKETLKEICEYHFFGGPRPNKW